MLRSVFVKSFGKDLALLVLRVLIGTLLMHHGYEKLNNIENFANAFIRPIHLPFPITLSYAAALSEIIGSWLLIAGLFTRIGSLAIIVTISGAIYHALLTSGFNIYLLELLVLYLGSVNTILMIGPGCFAIDELIIRQVEFLKISNGMQDRWFKEKDKNTITDVSLEQVPQNNVISLLKRNLAIK